MPKPHGGPGEPTQPPPTTCKDSIFKLWRQNSNIWRQNWNIQRQTCSLLTQRCGAKIQMFDHKFKSINVCTTKNLPLYTRKPPNPARQLVTHPPPFDVGKKLKCIPLALDVTVKTFFERLYLVPGLPGWAHWIRCNNGGGGGNFQK